MLASSYLEKCFKSRCFFFCSDFIGAALTCLSPVGYFITFHSISANGSFKYTGHRIDFSHVNDLVFANSFEWCFKKVLELSEFEPK